LGHEIECLSINLGQVRPGETSASGISAGVGRASSNAHRGAPLVLSLSCHTLRSVSIPVIPGYIDGPTGTRLLDLWQRPDGDFPDELWPVDVLETVTPDPTGWLIVCEHYFTEDSHGGRGCVLVAPEHRGDALASTSWIGHDLGQFSVWDDFQGGHGFGSGLHATERNASLEFFVQVRRPMGSSDPVVDISQPFLWYWDAYRVDDGWAYVNEAGRPQELVRLHVAREHWTIEVRALEFRQFLHACDRDAVLQIDCVPKTVEDEFERTDDEFTCEWAHFHFTASADRLTGSRPGFSRLLGQYLVLGSRTSRVPRFEERDGDRDFPAFVYGIDAKTGAPLRHTCDPDQLGTYFDEDNRRLHFLTPVNFKREVLIPYASEPNRYRLTRTRLACLSLWGLDISFNSAGLIEVYLGDLGQSLPSDEWGHWLSYNVLPEGKMEEGRFRRDFLAQFAPSPNIPGDLRRARSRISDASERVFGSPIWRPLGEDIGPEYESMIGPLSEDPAALNGPLILLTKCFVDAIDPAPLKIFLRDAEPGERSLSLLGRVAERIGGATDDVEPLRALYNFRSSGGVAHLAGSKREAALQRLGIQGLTTIAAFDHVATNLTRCLDHLTALMEQFPAGATSG
jgi:hypothetical protein